MTKNRYDLFKGKHNDENDMSVKKIAELRSQTKYYQDAHNTLIKEKWDLDLTIARCKPGQVIDALVASKKKIDEQIKKTDYQTKIDDLIEKIRELEIQIYGHSEVGSNSPYKL